MKIDTLADLDEHIARIETATGAQRHELMSFQYNVDVSRLKGLSPFCDEYRLAVEQSYLGLAGLRHYNSENEANSSGIDMFDPVPFSGRHPGPVGSHIGAAAFMVRNFPCLPPARVLEMGAGWGHTTLLLARTGYHVDALDINKESLALLDYWADRMMVSNKVRTICQSFEQVREMPEKYDTVLFFESFHHGLDPSRLIEDCKAVLTDTGAIVFASEPIHANWHIPWGLRSDSLSVYCIRRFGWVELGFSESYFLELLKQHGFYVNGMYSLDMPIATNYIAHKINGWIPFGHIAIPRDYMHGWAEPHSDMRWTTGNAVIPAALLPARGNLVLANYSPVALPVTVDDGTEKRLTLAPSGGRTEVPISPAGDVHIGCQPWKPADYGSDDPRTLGVAVLGIRV